MPTIVHAPPEEDSERESSEDSPGETHGAFGLSMNVLLISLELLKKFA